jgi:glycine cleavage system aminomethyltransferase T
MAAIRQSPLFHRHEQAGASFVDHYGWRVPACFTIAQKEVEQLSKSVAVSDVTWMVKLDVKGLQTPPEIVDGTAWRLGPRRFLVTCPPKASTLEVTPRVYITDVTSVYAQFLLAGPRSRDVLRKLTSLNVTTLGNLACGQASVAHAHGTLLRDDIGPIPAFHILVSREYGESVWDAILHAGHEFHVAPFGLDALESLGGRA